MRIHLVRITALILAGAAVAMSGCGTSHDNSNSDNTGNIGIALQVAPGISLNTVSYDITGPGGFDRKGTINVSGSTIVSTTIGGLPVGTGYTITLTATSTDGGTSCLGSGTFSVSAGMTSSVTIGLICHQGSSTGSVLINGTINVCAVIDGLSANPGEAQVGGSIALNSVAHDIDSAPAALAYQWTANSGTLANAATANPTLTCTAAGTVTLTLAVSDGDCGDTQSFTVTCSGSNGAGGSNGTAGAGGTAGKSGAGGNAAGGSAAGGSAAGGTTGGAGGSAVRASIVINEVESNGDAMGDWIELMNIGSSTADISGWKLKDDTDSHDFVVVPAGTSLAAGGFYRIYVFATFGLGAPDMARLFDPAGNLVDSYSWTTHANGTYGRCPNGTGAFVDSTPTPAAANACGSGAGGSSGTAGASGSGGSGTAGTSGAGGGGAGGAGGAGGSSGKTIVINEVESNGDAMGDWIELMNVTSTTADISGWKLKDDTDSHDFVVVPAGTSLAAGGFYRIYVFATFGLGAPDMARLFNPAGSLVDSYSWTTHATGTYGRCPDGTGAFVDSTPTPAAANACGGGAGGSSGAGGAGAGGAGGSGMAANEFAWPGTDTVITVDDLGAFTSNLSGLSYQPATATAPAVLWAIQNGPSKLYRLLWNGTTWESDMDNSWGAGKTIHYPSGSGDPDSEGVSKAEFADSAIYVSTERDNDNNQVNKFSVLRYDTTDAGINLTATNEWDLTADLPAMGINLGLEAITYVPDTALVAGGFFDEAAGALYNPASYPNHGTGLFFVGLESNGFIYGYALNHASNAFTRLATFSSGQVAIMDLSYDREVGYLWAQCDNTCNNKATVFKLDVTPASPTLGHFEIGRVFDRPASLPNSNFEGIGIAPESECVGGQKHFFWSDDSAADMHSIRRGSIPCGAFF